MAGVIMLSQKNSAVPAERAADEKLHSAAGRSRELPLHEGEQREHAAFPVVVRAA